MSPELVPNHADAAAAPAALVRAVSRVETGSLE